MSLAIGTSTTEPTVPGITTTTTTTTPAFSGFINPVTAERLAHSWREGCPVGPDGLRVVSVTYWDFSGLPQHGELIVSAGSAQSILEVFSKLFDLEFPIESVVPIGDLAPDAEDQPNYNNTSAFNCRFVEGTTSWSQHAYGLAIDINVQQNPYLSGNQLWPEGSDRYLDRSLNEPGMIHAGDGVVAAFESVGWSWGGDWTTAKDYQHFSATGN